MSTVASQFSADQINILFEKAPRSDSPDLFRLLPVLDKLSLGRLMDGESAILIQLEGTTQASSVEYGGLRLRLFEEANISIGSSRSLCPLGVISCTEQTLAHNFCILAADMCARRSLGEMTTSAQLREFVSHWAQLFSPVRQMTAERELGLWGELAVLASLPDPEAALAHWHGPESATFDFAGCDICIEVKTSTTEHIHHFALKQTSPPTPKSRLLIASLFVAIDPASGKSLDDQVMEVRRQLSASLDFDKKLAQLGFRPNVHTTRYSLSDLKYFAGPDIPRPRHLDDGVSDVRFVADLSRQARAPAKAIAAALKRLSS